MKRYLTSIIPDALLLMLCAWMGVFTACTGEVEVEEVPTVPSDSVELLFDVPCVYGYEGTATRAEVDGSTSGQRLFQTEEWPILDLDEGATVWLSYRPIVSTDSGTTYGEETTKPYVVRSYGAGYLSLYACGVRDSLDGGRTWLLPDQTVSEGPLYLSQGRYVFRIMSPAMPVTLVGNDYCSEIKNGIYFCSTDERYANTCGYEFDVTVGASGVQRITLNPMVWQVARFSFTICKGSEVSELQMMPAGIEVSGLQRPLTTTGDKTFYNWRSGSVSDTIPMKLGDKREWVRIRGDECQTAADGTITGDVGFLPTDAMSTVVVILFNLAVNGVPTQYETTIQQTRFYHGHNYRYKLTVNSATDITVANWSNQSWTTEATLK